jgi:hypothetical protein
MNGNYGKKMIIIMAVAAIVGFGVNAIAGWGKGYGPQGWGPHGPGWHQRGWDDQGYGYRARNLSEEDQKKMDEERRAFFDATEGIREELYANGQELRNELAKENPDAEKAAGIQNEISGLRSQLAQKRLNHILKMKEINPDAGRGFGRGFGGRGPKGYGRGGGGYCWR